MSVSNTKDLKKVIKASLNKGDLSKTMDLIISELNKDYKNVVLIESLKEEFIKEGLIQELIDLYNVEFYYTEDPKVFEKIGDIYFSQKNYESALNSYFDCAETTEGYSEIYRKLAQTFGELNDEQSKTACLEQFKLLSKKSD